jgi:hypothetical protein
MPAAAPATPEISTPPSNAIAAVIQSAPFLLMLSVELSIAGCMYSQAAQVNMPMPARAPIDF